MLFTLAHELGHLIAHHDPLSSFAVIDETTGSDADRRGTNAEERYADTFASALLMPPDSTGIALKKIRSLAKTDSGVIGDLEIAYLARIYGVSFWAAARRCEQLKILPPGGAFSLNAALIKSHGSAEKRAEQAGLPPRPVIDFPSIPSSLLASAVEKIQSGELSIGRASNLLGLSISELMAANAPIAH